MKPTLRPSRTLVRRVIGEEALRANVPADSVINIDRTGRQIAFAVMRRIIAETGCSACALADVWGCETSTVSGALAAPAKAPKAKTDPPKPKPWAGYDAATRERLTWKHGAARAKQIIEGRDPRTQSDIAKWRALGAHGSARA